MKKLITVTGLVSAALLLVFAASAQQRERGKDEEGDRIARLDPGTIIPVRTTQYIDSDKSDNRVYSASVDQDVRGETGRIVIPRGAAVELIVRVVENNELLLDVESVVVNDQRYGIKTDPKHVEARRDDNLIGGIVGAINGGETRGRAVRIPRDTVVTFRLQRPLELGVPDPGSMRDGQHYHPDQDRER